MLVAGSVGVVSRLITSCNLIGKLAACPMLHAEKACLQGEQSIKAMKFYCSILRLTPEGTRRVRLGLPVHNFSHIAAE